MYPKGIGNYEKTTLKKSRWEEICKFKSEIMKQKSIKVKETMK